MCDGAELPAAARMGPPERGEKRAKPGGEGGHGRVRRLGGIGLACQVGPGFRARPQGRFGCGALKRSSPDAGTRDVAGGTASGSSSQV